MQLTLRLLLLLNAPMSCLFLGTRLEIPANEDALYSMCGDILSRVEDMEVPEYTWTPKDSKFMAFWGCLLNAPGPRQQVK